VTEARTDILSIALPSVMPRMVLRFQQEERDVLMPRSSDVFAATVRRSGDRRTGHPRLRSAQHVAISPPLRPRGDGGDVGAGVRLRQREGRDQIAPEGRHEVAAAEILGAVLVDEMRSHQGLHRGGRRHRQRAARQLLGEEQYVTMSAPAPPYASGYRSPR